MTERRTEYRWFWVWDFEKEERWLNEMAANGWALVDVEYCKYTFEKTEYNEYTVRLEMHPSDENYITFMEDTGAEYIGRVLQWMYFRKRSELGSFDIFSDLDSRISHVRRIHMMILTLGLANLAIGIVNLSIGIFSTRNSFVAIFNLLVATLLMYGVGRMRGKIEYLENERRLRE
ncbi:MAG: DUF2812 domain-containing protein [Erysipelotrichaceae bacterium]|nr:DUF2812 domain-containing protein [Erysipelotrichaceae bacterium]